MTFVQNIQVSSEDNDTRLDRWFKRIMPNVSHVSVEKALRKGQIRVDGKRAKASYRLKTGEMLRVPPMIEYFKEKKEKPPVDPKYIKEIHRNIIFKDDDIIIINKPEGLSVQGGVGIRVSIDDIIEHLKFGFDDKPKLVHRIDKDTTGLLLLARKTSLATKLAGYFKDKKIDKTYWALVVGVPPEDEGKIDLPIMKRDIGAGKEKMVVDEEGKRAITFFKVIDKIGNHMSLVELRPITGRTHQLRVHMAEMGTPILGDGKYGGSYAFIEGMPDKMHLHARKMTIPEYKKEFIAPLTGTMRKTFMDLGLEALIN
jgi:23S rRNA pseudouridine955/2504/2580 synthase